MKTKIYPVLVTRRQDRDELWADGSALPMGCLTSYAKAYKAGTLKDKFDFLPLVRRQVSDWDFYFDEADRQAPGIWLFSSYMWNYKDNLQIAKVVKEKSPQSLIIAGGPHIPAYVEQNRQFFQDHPFIDITVRGEGEVALAEILEAIATGKTTAPISGDFSHINGITFRRGAEVVRTTDRVRTRNLDIFPSPYLTGEFNDKSFDDLSIMVLETNRGCPFGCTFCDWGSATLQKFSLFDLERVKKEIEIIASKRAHCLYLGDSNFGAFERDVEIAKIIAETKKKTGYPWNFATSFAKNASPRLAEIMKILRTEGLIAYGLISLQSTDKNVLTAINRSNIRNEKYEQLIKIFKKEKLTLSSELLIGLPGQTIQSHKEDLQFFIDRKLMTFVFNTAVMPNAPMNDPEYRKKYQIVTDENDYIISTSTFTYEQYQQMFHLYLAFQFFYVLGVLKYYLYFLQMDYSIRVMDFIEALLRASNDNRDHYPLSYRIQQELLTKVDPKRKGMPILQWETDDSRFLFDHLDAFYDEVVLFTKNEYGIDLTESEKQAVITTQKAVMPIIGKKVPFVSEVDHDFVAYFEQISKIDCVSSVQDSFQKLSTFPKATFKVKALKEKTITHLTLNRVDQYNSSGWELRSALRF